MATSSLNQAKERQARSDMKRTKDAIEVEHDFLEVKLALGSKRNITFSRAEEREGYDDLHKIDVLFLSCQSLYCFEGMTFMLTPKGFADVTNLHPAPALIRKFYGQTIDAMKQSAFYLKEAAQCFHEAVKPGGDRKAAQSIKDLMALLTEYGQVAREFFLIARQFSEYAKTLITNGTDASDSEKEFDRIMQLKNTLEETKLAEIRSRDPKKHTGLK